MRLSRPVRSLAIGSVAMAVAAGLTACGGSAESPAASAAPVEIEGVGTIGVDASLRDMLPEEYLSEDSIVVATNAPFAPYEMFASESDQTLVGLDPDLGHAVGALLGLPFEFQQQPFDGMIPGVQAGKYDLVMASLFDTAEREQVVDMVNYSASGSGLLVAAGNPEGYETSADLCGAAVAVQTGSAQVAIADGFSAACTAGGEAAVTATSYPAYSDELLALSTGTVTAVIGDIPAMSYSLAAEENTGKFELVLEPDLPNGYESAPVGIAVSKASGLTDAIHAAVAKLMEDGTYDTLLAKWNVTDIAIDESTVNAASD